MAQSDVSVVLWRRHLHDFVAFVLVVHFATFFVTCKWWQGLRCMVAQMQPLSDVRNAYYYQWQFHSARFTPLRVLIVCQCTRMQ